MVPTLPFTQAVFQELSARHWITYVVVVVVVVFVCMLPIGVYIAVPPKTGWAIIGCTGCPIIIGCAIIG